MIIGKIVTNLEINNYIDQVKEILKEVFVEEKGYKEDVVFNIDGAQKYHVLLYEDIKEDDLVAYGRLIINMDIANIMLIAVKQNYRGKKYGDLVIRMLIDKAMSMSYKDIYTDVPDSHVGMFEKVGFYKVVDAQYMKSNKIKLKYNINRQKSCQ